MCLQTKNAFTVILPSVIRTFDNLNLPLTQSHFCFFSDHFYVLLSLITRTMFWLKQVGKENSILASKILNFEFPIDVHYLGYVLLRYFWFIIEKYSMWPVSVRSLVCDFSKNDKIFRREKKIWRIIKDIVIYWLAFFHMMTFWFSCYGWRHEIKVCWQVGLICLFWSLDFCSTPNYMVLFT